MDHVHEEKTNNFHYKVEYDPKTEVMQILYEGAINYDKAIDALKAQMKFTEDHNVVGQLIDMTNLKGTFTKLNKYIKEDVAPHLEKRGVKYSAIAFGKDPFTRFAINQAIKITSQSTTIESKVFKHMEEAQKWLYDKMGYIA